MNVIGSRADRWWNDPDRAIRGLIEELDRYASATDANVTVVFDRRPPGIAPGRHGATTVAFAAARGRNAADNDIVRMVREDPAPHSVRVVTSDRELVDRVRELGATTVPAMSFRRHVMATLQGGDADGT